MPSVIPKRNEMRCPCGCSTQGRDIHSQKLTVPCNRALSCDLLLCSAVWYMAHCRNLSTPGACHVPTCALPRVMCSMCGNCAHVQDWI
jgi:hypothetical protein